MVLIIVTTFVIFVALTRQARKFGSFHGALMFRGVKTLRKQSLTHPKSIPDGESAAGAVSHPKLLNETAAAPFPHLTNNGQKKAQTAKSEKLKSDDYVCSCTPTEGRRGVCSEPLLVEQNENEDKSNPQHRRTAHLITPSEIGVERSNQSSLSPQKSRQHQILVNNRASSPSGRATQKHKHYSEHSIASLGELTPSETLESCFPPAAGNGGSEGPITTEKINGGGPLGTSSLLEQEVHSAQKKASANQINSQKPLANTSMGAVVSSESRQLTLCLPFQSPEEPVQFRVRDRIGSAGSALSVRSNKSVSVSICSNGSRTYKEVEYRTYGTRTFNARTAFQA